MIAGLYLLPRLFDVLERQCRENHRFADPLAEQPKSAAAQKKGGKLLPVFICIA